MKDKDIITKCAAKIAQIINRYKGKKEAAMLTVVAIPKKNTPKPFEDNLDSQVGYGGNPYAIADAMIRKGNQDEIFKAFLLETITAISNGLEPPELN